MPDSFVSLAQDEQAEILNGASPKLGRRAGLAGFGGGLWKMKSTGMLNDDAPEFGELMEQIRDIEKAINSWP